MKSISQTQDVLNQKNEENNNNVPKGFVLVFTEKILQLDSLLNIIPQEKTGNTVTLL